MTNTFTLEILTPDRQFFVGEAEAMVLPILDGQYGVQPGHEPVVTAIEPGELKYKVDGVWHVASVSTGFAEIMPDYAILLVAACERPEEIDLRRAEAARERAEERLRQHGSIQQYHSSQAALARALARLKTARK